MAGVIGGNGPTRIFKEGEMGTTKGVTTESFKVISDGQVINVIEGGEIVNDVRVEVDPERSKITVHRDWEVVEP